MKTYRFKIDNFMEMFCEISGYDRELYASKIAEKSADYIVRQYMNLSVEYWFSEECMEDCIEQLIEVFDLDDSSVRQAFVENTYENTFCGHLP